MQFRTVLAASQTSWAFKKNPDKDFINEQISGMTFKTQRKLIEHYNYGLEVVTEPEFGCSGIRKPTIWVSDQVRLKVKNHKNADP